MSERYAVTWAPAWAPHVSGSYEPREALEEGEAQRWEARCGKCGAEHRGECPRLAARGHIAKFAALHAHGTAF